MYGGGETPRLARGESDEYFCMRDYFPGDDLRRIAWKTSARLRKLVVREMEPSTSRNVIGAGGMTVSADMGGIAIIAGCR